MENPKELQELLDTFVWVTLKNEVDFLKVKETLTRIGVASKTERTLWQSVHILYKQGKYALVHFKELFALDGKETNFTENDKARRNTIANLLAEWGLVQLVDPIKSKEPVALMSQIKVIPFREKSEWNLCQKYQIGKSRKRPVNDR